MPRNPRPLVSVIMPVHNGAEFISEAVESVLAQSYSPCELIVVDDGSTDDTVLALEPFMSRLQFLQQDHRGSSAARNYGLSIASGDYIAFLDADDIFPPRTIEQRTSRFSAAPSAGMVCSGWRIVDIEGRPVIDYRPWEEDPELDLASLLLRKPVNVGSITCRRECIDQVGGFDDELEHAQDIDLAFQIALVGYELVWDREIGVLYRRRPGSASHSGPIQAWMMDRALDKVFRAPGLDPRVREIEPAVRYYTDVWNAWHAAQLNYWGEARQRLSQAIDHVPKPNPAVPFQWMNMFEAWSRKYWYTALEPERMYVAIRAVIPPPDESISGAADRLDFWWRVWRHYLDGRDAQAKAGLSAFNRIPTSSLVKWAQTMIFALDAEIRPEMLARFWSDAQAHGLASEADAREIVTLYLYASSKQVVERRWIHAIRFLLAALSAGLHPSALIRWIRFFRSGVRYAVRRSNG